MRQSVDCRGHSSAYGEGGRGRALSETPRRLPRTQAREAPGRCSPRQAGRCFPWKVGSFWSIQSSWLMVVPYVMKNGPLRCK